MKKEEEQKHRIIEKKLHDLSVAINVLEKFLRKVTGNNSFDDKEENLVFNEEHTGALNHFLIATPEIIDVNIKKIYAVIEQLNKELF